MSSLRGDRFHVDLDDNDNESVPIPQLPVSDFVGDIQEREVTTTNPPAPPSLKNEASGFPPHKDRSKFKQARKAASNPVSASPPAAAPQTQAALEKMQIDDENKQKLDAMSPEEIQQEQAELMSSLDPSLIERLLQRSTIDDDVTAKPDWNSSELKVSKASRPAAHARKVSFAVPDDEPAEPQPRPTAERHSISYTDASGTPTSLDENSVPRKHSLNPLDATPPPDSNVHFPKPPSTDLDPESETFLDDLHSKYFPNLDHDPSKLAWMRPADAAADAAYDPGVSGVAPPDIRFSFAGAIIPPSVSHALPTNLGLHNHGDAPSAAGYTVPELARLSRSAVPGQRCLAMQTLGRVLYRLGSGEFGDENDMDVDGADGERARLAKGLWELVTEGRCTETLTTEANRTAGHQTSIAVAQEAVWLWQRGGGRKRKAV